jgi:hypothetical protein
VDAVLRDSEGALESHDGVTEHEPVMVKADVVHGTGHIAPGVEAARRI